MRLYRHILLLFLLIWSAVLVVPAQGQSSSSKETKAVIRAWQMTNDYGVADSVMVDTLPTNMHARNVLNDRSISWAYDANLVSPTQSKIYFDRSGNGLLSSTGTGSDEWVNGGLQPMGGVRPKMDFMFGAAYEPYIYTPRDVHFYRTTIAYSDIAYKKTFKTYREENDLHFSFTGNINKRTNIGVLMNYLVSNGRYSNQEGKLFNGYLHGSYDGKNYGLHGALTFANLSNFENGGITDVTHIGKDKSLNPEDMPVRLSGMSGFSYISGYLDHHYTIRKQRDSIDVPMISINHVFETNNARKRYKEQTANQQYFDNTYLNRQATNDSANVLNIRNTVAVSLHEEFNRVLRFGASAYVTNECQRVLYQRGSYDTIPNGGVFGNAMDAFDKQMHIMSDTLMASRWMNNTMVGGAIYMKNNRWFRYQANGDVCLLGYKLGEFQVNGQVEATIPLGKDSLLVRASAYIKNETPSWYVQHYRSNHYMWDNSFGKTYRFFVGGEVCYPYEWVKLRAKVGFENISRPIYFTRQGLPEQMDGNVQVLSGDLRADLTTPWINLENTVVYQYSSSEFVPLPALTLHHNLYYHGWWFRKAVYAQWGVDMRFHTKYYAPILNPATGQFCVQDEVKIGNYPDMNLYANFYVKHIKLRFFFEWEHFSYVFMKQQQAHLFMPNYPMNPSVFRAGAAWHFWR